MTPDEKTQLQNHFRDKIREFGAAMGEELTPAKVDEILQNVMNQLILGRAESPLLRSTGGVILAGLQ